MTMLSFGGIHCSHFCPCPGSLRPRFKVERGRQREKERERETKYLIGSPWVTNSYMEGGASDSPTRPQTMGKGSSPKGYRGAVPRRREK